MSSVLLALDCPWCFSLGLDRDWDFLAGSVVALDIGKIGARERSARFGLVVRRAQVSFDLRLRSLFFALDSAVFQNKTVINMTGHNITEVKLSAYRPISRIAMHRPGDLQRGCLSQPSPSLSLSITFLAPINLSIVETCPINPQLRAICPRIPLLPHQARTTNPSSTML